MRHVISAIASVAALSAVSSAQAGDNLPAAGVLSQSPTVASLYDNSGTMTGRPLPAPKTQTATQTPAPTPIPAPAQKTAHTRPAKTFHVQHRALIRPRPSVSPDYALGTSISEPPPVPVYMQQTAPAPVAAGRGLFGHSPSPAQTQMVQNAPPSNSGWRSLGNIFAPSPRSPNGERGLFTSGKSAAPAAPQVYVQPAPQYGQSRIY